MIKSLIVLLALVNIVIFIFTGCGESGQKRRAVDVPKSMQAVFDKEMKSVGCGIKVGRAHENVVVECDPTDDVQVIAQRSKVMNSFVTQAVESLREGQLSEVDSRKVIGMVEGATRYKVRQEISGVGIEDQDYAQSAGELKKLENQIKETEAEIDQAKQLRASEQELAIAGDEYTEIPTEKDIEDLQTKMTEQEASYNEIHEHLAAADQNAIDVLVDKRSVELQTLSQGGCVLKEGQAGFECDEKQLTKSILSNYVAVVKLEELARNHLSLVSLTDENKDAVEIEYKAATALRENLFARIVKRG